MKLKNHLNGGLSNFKWFICDYKDYLIFIFLRYFMGFSRVSLLYMALVGLWGRYDLSRLGFPAGLWGLLLLGYLGFPVCLLGRWGLVCTVCSSTYNGGIRRIRNGALFPVLFPNMSLLLLLYCFVFSGAQILLLFFNCKIFLKILTCAPYYIVYWPALNLLITFFADFFLRDSVSVPPKYSIIRVKGLWTQE